MTDDQPPQNAVKAPSAEGLAQAAGKATKKGPPPVHLWNPPFCGDLDMEIHRDGTWFYLGTPIGRQPLVKLFASILKLEDGKYFLVTPVEKVGIRVVDAPFVAVDCTVSGTGEAQDLTFTTNVGDSVTAGAENPIRVVRAPDGEPSPYVHIRRGLEALIDRKTFYRLIDIAVPGPHEGQDWLGLWSGGQFFPVIPMAEL
ncbi:DUF1285 domain-containing protein [Sinirhodobacter sp. WL0062]|uniref:DUF1285 domain-containing protein n=1 Tax=Rhodobacter flavimaris TaxID=2907145 RepID=A0ABS8YVF9_9RHOB|nr:DUF1285 domain-containing protein [Sinirhodobacter sp. WL0062]MCE5973478.1 DUF1285 domain-containing protein [Sinirhodobacter sp. WL0062]